MNRREVLSAICVLAGSTVTKNLYAQVSPPRPASKVVGTRVRRPLSSTPFSDPPRSSFGHVRVGNRLYIAGGHLGEYHDYMGEDFTAEFLEVDLTTGVWRRLTSHPFPVQGLRLAEDQGWIYAFGGFRHEPAFDYSPGWRPNETRWAARSDDRVVRYSLVENRWQDLGPMPRRRSSNVLLKAGRRIYLVAGWDGTLPIRDNRSGYWHSAIDVFDLDRQAFVPYDAILAKPTRRALSSAEWNGKLVLTAGLGETPPMQRPPHYDLITVFDPATGGFDDTVFPRLPAQLFSPGACFTGSRLVVAGGMDEKYAIRDTIWTCSPGDSTWAESKTKLPAKAMFPELIPIAANRILVVGGHGDDEAQQLPLAMWAELTI